MPDSKTWPQIWLVRDPGDTIPYGGWHLENPDAGVPDPHDEAQRYVPLETIRERLDEAVGEIRMRARRSRELDPERTGLNRDGHCTAKASAYEHAAEILAAAFKEDTGDQRRGR